MNSMTCFINNHFLPLSGATVPVTDLGLQRGYGIFDFLRVTDYVPLFQDDHLERFYRSAEIMQLAPGKTKDELKNIISELIRRNDVPHAGIKILLTGGSSPDGYTIAAPNLAIIQQPLNPPPATIFLPGYRLVTYAHQRQMPEVKTTDYLVAIHLQPWLREKKADDLLYHQNGIVSECPRSNFFIVTKNDTLVTPGKNILKGITRKQLLRIASDMSVAVEERDVSMEDICEAKEAFITSSTRRLIPVTQVDEIILPPFSENSVTARLFDAFCEWELSAIHRYRN